MTIYVRIPIVELILILSPLIGYTIYCHVLPSSEAFISPDELGVVKIVSIADDVVICESETGVRVSLFSTLNKNKIGKSCTLRVHNGKYIFHRIVINGNEVYQD